MKHSGNMGHQSKNGEKLGFRAFFKYMWQSRKIYSCYDVLSILAVTLSQLKIIETNRTKNKVNCAAKVCQTQSTGSKDTGLRNFGRKKIPVRKIHYYLQENQNFICHFSSYAHCKKILKFWAKLSQQVSQLQGCP